MCLVSAVAVAVEEVVSVVAAVAAQTVAAVVDVSVAVEQTDSRVFSADSGSC